MMIGTLQENQILFIAKLTCLNLLLLLLLQLGWGLLLLKLPEYCASSAKWFNTSSPFASLREHISPVSTKWSSQLQKISK